MWSCSTPREMKSHLRSCSFYRLCICQLFHISFLWRCDRLWRNKPSGCWHCVRRLAGSCIPVFTQQIVSIELRQQTPHAISQNWCVKPTAVCTFGEVTCKITMPFEKMFPDSPSAKFFVALWGCWGKLGAKRRFLLPRDCCGKPRGEPCLWSGGMWQ